jgi:hypothetical protein
VFIILFSFYSLSSYSKDDAPDTALLSSPSATKQGAKKITIPQIDELKVGYCLKYNMGSTQLASENEIKLNLIHVVDRKSANYIIYKSINNTYSFDTTSMNFFPKKQVSYNCYCLNEKGCADTPLPLGVDSCPTIDCSYANQPEIPSPGMEGCRLVSQSSGDSYTLGDITLDTRAYQIICDVNEINPVFVDSLGHQVSISVLASKEIPVVNPEMCNAEAAVRIDFNKNLSMSLVGYIDETGSHGDTEGCGE